LLPPSRPSREWRGLIVLEAEVTVTRVPVFIDYAYHCAREALVSRLGNVLKI